MLSATGDNGTYFHRHNIMQHFSLTSLVRGTAAALLCAGALAAGSSFAADSSIPDPFAAMKQQSSAVQPVQDTNPFGSAQSAPIVIPQPPVFDAESWLLMDYASGQVLFEHDSQKQIWPASLTKMMTSYVIGMEFKAGRLKDDDKVVITEEAWSKNKDYSDSSKMFIEVGKEIPAGDLNRGIIIQSGNDACVALALHLAGSEEGFVSVMNNYAQQMGLTGTHFSNVHGLFDENNYSTAYDMAVLGRHLIADLPREYAIYAEKEFTFNGIRQYNRNRLLWDKTLHVDGIKTGHLSQVGYNLVASAAQGNMRLIAVVIGAKSEKARADYARQMLNYGFRFFELYTPFTQGQTILSREVRMGDSQSVDLVVPEPVQIMVPRGSQQRMQINYRLNQSVFTAPLSAGQQLGIIEFKLDDKVLAQYPLCAKEAVAEGGFISRMWDKAIMFFTSD